MTTPSRRAAATIAVAALLAPLAACTSADTAPPTGTDGALIAFHEQELDWEACEGYTTTSVESEILALASTAECARLAVPLDYDDPAGDEASIAVVRIPARGEAVAPLVTNPGGPGGTGIMTAALMTLSLPDSEITERFDIVGFDPRGVGASVPAVSCMTDAEADDGSVRTSSIDGTTAWTPETTRDLLERCADGVGGAEVLPHLGTRDAARDMDVLRAALGQEQLTYLGQSYGSRLGAVYAEQFPDRVRAMVLDGAGDPTAGTIERRIQAYAGFQGAFEEFTAWCTSLADCPLGTDPAAALERYHAIVRPLLDAPVPALGRELTFDDAIGGLISGLYSQAAWPRMSAGLAELRNGTGDELLQLGRDFVGRAPGGEWPSFTSSNLVIDCMDEQRFDADQAQDLREAIHEAAPFMDPGIEVPGARDACEQWPAEPSLGIPYAQDVVGLPTTLVVSITGDPTTPHAGAVVMAESLGSALLTVEGVGHTTIMGGTTPCADAIVARYLVDLEAPADGATCRLGQ